MHRRTFAVVVILAASLSGCLRSATLVKIKPDGSGTIEQTMAVNLQAIKGLMAGMGGGGQMKETGGVLNEAEFKRTAERMGVKPVSVTPFKDGGFEGAKALFAFDDITKVRIDQDPQMGGAGGGSGRSSSGTPIKFTHARQGGSSVLTITVDEQTVADAGAKAGANKPSLDQVDPAMMQMIKTMFQGFQISIDLEVEGKIVKTNADYVNGSRITLVELDVASLLADEAKLKALEGLIGPDMSIAQLRPQLKDVKGIKINHPKLSIEYR
ncbi:MAG: hypothetical protein ACT4QD_25495 [Acidobacteriota bacterium]